MRQKLGRRAKQFGLKANRSQQIFQRAPHGWIVFNNENAVLQLYHSALAPIGSVKLRTAPNGDRRSAHNRPPCASMIDRLIASPIPIPSFLVVKNGSKMNSIRAAGKPCPQSRTWVRTYSALLDDLICSSRVRSVISVMASR